MFKAQIHVLNWVASSILEELGVPLHDVRRPKRGKVLLQLVPPRVYFAYQDCLEHDISASVESTMI
jgi:hypothetical protein